MAHILTSRFVPGLVFGALLGCSAIELHARQVVAEGADYATAVLGDPWDMGNAEDIYPLTSVHNLEEIRTEALLGHSASPTRRHNGFFADTARLVAPRHGCGRNGAG